MSVMFPGQTLVTGGTFTINAPVINNQLQARLLLNLLHPHVASGAFHNSSERYDPPKCHPGTREAIMRDVMDWVETAEGHEFFLWLYGPAGSGKSAIAQSIAEWASNANLLAATFFFSRTAGTNRNDATLLIPTLAYQIATAIPKILEPIGLAIEKDPLIFKRSLNAQLESLILQPLSTLSAQEQVVETSGLDGDDSGNTSKSLAPPRLVIIDGLDECDGPVTQRYILKTLAGSLRRYSVPLIFLIASRPEHEIREVFNQEEMNSMTRRIVLDDHYQPDADIRLFLSAKFNEIKLNHPLASQLPDNWPTPSEIDRLVSKSSGQFIYASTVVKFVQSSRHRPTNRLEIVFGVETAGKQTPFAELDLLYSMIFASVENIDSVLDVCSYLLLFPKQFHVDTQTMVEEFWGYPPGDLQIILTDLHSIISVPDPKSPRQNLRFFHASLADFLLDRSRSGKYFLDAPVAKARLAGRCIKNAASMVGSKNLKSTGDRPHLDLSCINLLATCIDAHPTDEILRDLRSFPFDGFLALQFVDTGTGSHFLWEFISTALPNFFEWLQLLQKVRYGFRIMHDENLSIIELQCYPTHVKGCLCKQYTKALDEHLWKTLNSIPRISEESYQHLLTSMTLNSFPNDVPALLDIIPESLPPSYEYDIKFDSVLDLKSYRNHSGHHSKYHLMLIAFLTDCSRSGSLYRDKAQYLDLACKFLEYMCHRPYDSRFSHSDSQLIDTDKCASSGLHEIMARFPGDDQLVRLLCANTIRKGFFDREKMLLAIDSYIKAYHLSTTRSPATDMENETVRGSRKRKASADDLYVGNYKHLNNRNDPRDDEIEETVHELDNFERPEAQL